ncbi:hypothetical protein [Clostridium estertheticum]|nr:hypothetical protein [Clostridium estertheticum]
MLVSEFDDELWNATIEKVLVHSEHDITFIRVRLEEIRTPTELM